MDIELGRIYIVLSDDVERRLRLSIVQRLGGKKGSLSGAIQEAVIDWLKKDAKARNWTADRKVTLNIHSLGYKFSQFSVDGKQLSELNRRKIDDKWKRA